MNEEQVDILDEQGNKTGQSLNKSQAHKEELRHGVAHIWLYNKKAQMLMQLRHKDVLWGANQWDLSAGGHISAGETPEVAALREAKEELGLQLQPADLYLVAITQAVNTTPSTQKLHKTFEWNYIAETDIEPSDLTLQTDETSEAVWLTIDEVEKTCQTSKFAPRDNQLYQQVITAIRNKLDQS